MARVSFDLESLEITGNTKEGKWYAIQDRNIILDPMPVLVPAGVIVEACRAIKVKPVVPGPCFFKFEGAENGPGKVEFRVWDSVFGAQAVGGSLPGGYHELLGQNGRDLRVGLSVSYLRQVLDLFAAATHEGHSEVQFKASNGGMDAEASIRFVPIDQAQKNIEAILMPVRLQ